MAPIVGTIVTIQGMRFERTALGWEDMQTSQIAGPEWLPRIHRALERNKRRREKDRLMADLGLTKVRGAISGRVYYE